jgi:hypothetical protein
VIGEQQAREKVKHAMRDAKNADTNKRSSDYYAAAAKLVDNGGDVIKLNKSEIATILLVEFGVDVGSLLKKRNQKGTLVKKLTSYMA